MKLRDLERHIAAHGARKVAEGAEHTKWRSAEIGPGLARAICRQLGVPTP